jgi:tetratricopeptide (TPR) repeat protein
VQYFGQGNPYGKYPSLGKIVDTITTLDPKFEYPYEFGMIVLPFMDQTDVAAKIGERAQQAIPGNGLLSFYLAGVYHINVKDYKKAADLYAKSAAEGGPGAAKELAGVALASVNGTLSDRQAALAFWKTVFDNAKDDAERDRAANWYGHMQLVYALELAAEQFHKDKGHYPASLEELRDAKYIPGIPQSPIGRRLDLDPATGKIDFSHVQES